MWTSADVAPTAIEKGLLARQGMMGEVGSNLTAAVGPFFSAETKRSGVEKIEVELAFAQVRKNDTLIQASQSYVDANTR